MGLSPIPRLWLPLAAGAGEDQARAADLALAVADHLGGVLGGDAGGGDVAAERVVVYPGRMRPGGVDLRGSAGMSASLVLTSDRSGPRLARL